MVYRWCNEEGPPPWPVVLFNRCRMYNALPDAGGVLDQNEQVMELMNWCQLVKSWQGATAKDMTNWTSDVFEYVGKIRAMVREARQNGR